jgi:hypothetical protein
MVPHVAFALAGAVLRPHGRCLFATSTTGARRVLTGNGTFTGARLKASFTTSPSTFRVSSPPTAIRDSIMKLLSDEEIAKVTATESATSRMEGDKYIDLEELDQGVQR